MPRSTSTPDVTFKTLTLAVAYTGDETRATIATDESAYGASVISEGKAKRRKGDPRNTQIGIALATSRALRQLADAEEEWAQAQLEGPKKEPAE